LSAINKYIDLAVLKPGTTWRDVEAKALFAREYGLASICVPTVYVQDVKAIYRHVSTVIGFPCGYSSPNGKFYEAGQAIADGATELDVVVWPGHIDFELRPIVDYAHAHRILVKAIVETAVYREHLRSICLSCIHSGVDFLKSSTGFFGNPTNRDIEILLEATRGTTVRVKASGGIQTYEDAKHFIDMGCMRIGTSHLEVLG
jgi:deoxyribose-phosphate aldolase